MTLYVFLSLSETLYIPFRRSKYVIRIFEEIRDGLLDWCYLYLTKIN